jgi:hypothetical protein
MNRITTLLASLATISGLCVATFQLGYSQASQSVESVRVNIDNTIEGVIQKIPQENREGVAELLDPIAQLIDSKLQKEPIKPERYQDTAEHLQQNIQQLSLVSYRADTSPFVPPKNKAQFLCGEAFTMAYSGQHNKNSLTASLKINSNSYLIKPGDIQVFNTEVNFLEITYLEYKKELDGPILKYVCGKR